MSAQSSRYSAFSVTGKVQVKHESQWVDVTKRMPLGAFDELRISERGSIKILENKTNRIFKNNGSGIVTVRQLVKDAKSKSGNSLSNLTQSFTDGMSTKGNNGNRLCTVGAVHRGNSTADSFEDSVCSSIAYFVSSFLNTDYPLEDSIIIGMRIMDLDSYIIHLENRSDLPFCINIVSVDTESRKCRLLLSPGSEQGRPYIVLDAHAEVALDDFVYRYNPKERLFVFASERLFDMEEVEAMLEHYPIDEGEELFKMQYYEIK